MLNHNSVYFQYLLMCLLLKLLYLKTLFVTKLKTKKSVWLQIHFQRTLHLAYFKMFTNVCFPTMDKRIEKEMASALLKQTTATVSPRSAEICALNKQCMYHIREEIISEHIKGSVETFAGFFFVGH